MKLNILATVIVASCVYFVPSVSGAAEAKSTATESAVPAFVSVPKKDIKDMTPEELTERRKRAHANFLRRRQEAIERGGGPIEAPIVGNIIAVYNEQGRVDESDINAAISRFQEHLRLHVKMNAPREQAGVSISFIDNDKEPTLTIAPEEGLARINVAKLAADRPTKDVLRARTVKEFWRALAFVLGASNSMYQPCLMRSIHSLQDLDAETIEMTSPEPFAKMSSEAKKMKLAPKRTVVYRTACFEGWAPPPTNDVQRAIVKGVKDGTLKPPRKSTPEKYPAR